jgi:hypothetical protein
MADEPQQHDRRHAQDGAALVSSVMLRIRHPQAIGHGNFSGRFSTRSGL